MSSRAFVAPLGLHTLAALAALAALATACVDPDDGGADGVGDFSRGGPDSSSGVGGDSPGLPALATLPASTLPIPRDRPHPIARDVAGAQGLSLHGGFAYFLAPAGGGGASIVSVPERGGAVTELVGGHDPWGFGFDRHAIYWADLSAKAILATTRAGAPPALVADAGGLPVHFAMDASHVYWATPDGEVRAVTKADRQVVRLARVDDSPLGLAIDASFVYVAAGDALYRVSRGGGPLEKIAAGESFGAWLLVDRHSIYWASPAERTVRRLDKGAARPVTLASQVDATGAALGPDWLYFSDAGERAVKKVLLTGGNPLLIAGGQVDPTDVAVDGLGVYWIDAGAGTVMWAPLAL